jgi:hypothetical protein
MGIIKQRNCIHLLPPSGKYFVNSNCDYGKNLRALFIFLFEASPTRSLIQSPFLSIITGAAITRIDHARFQSVSGGKCIDRRFNRGEPNAIDSPVKIVLALRPLSGFGPHQYRR